MKYTAPVLGILMLILSGCTTPTNNSQSPTQNTAATAQQNQPELTVSNPAEALAVVGELLSAMQANDAGRIQAVFSQDAQNGNNALMSGEAFRAWLESDIIAAEAQVIDSELSVAEGGIVVTGTYIDNSGFQRPVNLLMLVEDGKITSWTTR